MTSGSEMSAKHARTAHRRRRHSDSELGMPSAKRCFRRKAKSANQTVRVSECRCDHARPARPIPSQAGLVSEARFPEAFNRQAVAQTFLSPMAAGMPVRRRTAIFRDQRVSSSVSAGAGSKTFRTAPTQHRLRQLESTWIQRESRTDRLYQRLPQTPKTIEKMDFAPARGGDRSSNWRSQTWLRGNSQETGLRQREGYRTWQNRGGRGATACIRNLHPPAHTDRYPQS